MINGDGTECIDFESCTGDNNECYDKDFNTHDVCTKGTFEPPTCSCAAGWEHVPIPDVGVADPSTYWPATQVGTCNKNVDKCIATPDICDGREYTTCLDNAGSYECQCNDGYSRDGNLVAAGTISIAADGQGCFKISMNVHTLARKIIQGVQVSTVPMSSVLTEHVLKDTPVHVQKELK